MAPYPRFSAVRPLVLCFCTSLVRLCRRPWLIPGSALFSRLPVFLGIILATVFVLVRGPLQQSFRILLASSSSALDVICVHAIKIINIKHELCCGSLIYVNYCSVSLTNQKLSAIGWRRLLAGFFLRLLACALWLVCLPPAACRPLGCPPPAACYISGY